MKTLKQRYDYIIQTYIDQFCAKHNLECERHDDEGAVLNGSYYSMRRIREDIDGISATPRMPIVRKSITPILHPFTCDCSGKEKCERLNKTGEGEMKCINGYFTCPCGAFVQHKCQSK